MVAPRISLNLLIDNKRKRVLFAEAGKDFVDFLLETFTLPVVTVTRFLKKEGMQFGSCLQSLYESIENLSDTCILPGRSKDLVLKPKVVMYGGTDSFLLPKVESYTLKKKFYKCRNSSCSIRDYRLSSTHGGYCYACKSSSMDDEVTFEELLSGNKSSGNLNLLKEGVTYMVTDDLEMEPISADNFITLLNEYDITDVGALEKKVVVLGKDECVKLLKAALQSKTVLTDVFLSRPTEMKESIETGIGTSDEMLRVEGEAENDRIEVMSPDEEVGYA
ncbi:hypothetical protein I3843_08G028900 [Carya illinoinensis]|nr:hypothetical protein I3843_08G028900 [Carya illinoinensis]